MRRRLRACFPGVRGMWIARVTLLPAAVILAAGCTVGPNYKRPSAPAATKWDVAEPWRESAPKDSIPKGPWWTVFRDDDLSALETQALSANQTLKVWVGRDIQESADPVLEVWLGYTPLDADQRTNRTFGYLSVKKPRVPGIIHLRGQQFDERLSARSCDPGHGLGCCRLPDPVDDRRDRSVDGNVDGEKRAAQLAVQRLH